MNIKIGAMIKKLRMENNFTQDTMAAAIGVTPQAISRWESEGGYPDIELLPLIANFFAVSTDDLLGYKISEREKKLTDIKEALSRLAEVGTIDERIDSARTALSKYPSDCEIKENLSQCLYQKYMDTKDEAVLSEAEHLAGSVVENCRDENVRYNAVTLLANIYASLKRADKALAMINMLTPMKYCRESALSRGIGDGKNELYKQDEIDKLTDGLGIAIRNLALDDELPNDSSTWDNKIKIINLSNELYFLIYGKDLMFYHCRLAVNYWLLSTYQISQGKIEETFSSLEKMCNHAVAYDKSFKNDHGKHYTSLLVDQLIYPERSKDFHELTEHSQCWHMLNQMQSRRYDIIRTDEHFIKIVKTLNKSAW